MENYEMQGITKYISAHLRKRKWLSVVTCLAAVVVFCTVYALILPAITQENNVYCGKTEHRHSEEECYERILICGQEEGVTEGHVHDESCYETKKVLICELEEGERPGHVHGDDCYNENGELICGQEETEAYSHVHDESCYETITTLVCGQEETEPKIIHQHTDDCYELVLTCKQEEHTHSLACYSNPSADVENSAVWEATVSKIELTGVWADDLLAVAKTQLGYTESTANYVVMEDGESTKGYTRYGAWYGIPYGDWCAMFVSFCLNYADIPTEYFSRSAGCQSWIEMLSGRADGYKDFDLYREAGKYIPLPGDLIFFDWDKDDDADHVGIVAEYTEAIYDEDGVMETPAQIKTIEGNSSEKVQYVTYDADNIYIMGYGMLPKNPENERESVSLLNENDAQEPSQLIVQNFTVTPIEGAEVNEEGQYVWTPTNSEAGHSFVYRADYTISGPHSQGEKTILITLPLHILKDRDGNWADTFDCPYLRADEVPEGSNPDFVYEINEEKNEVYIYNYAEISSGESGYLEFSYTTTRPTLDYEDMAPSDEVKAKITVQGESGDTVGADGAADKVYIDTHAAISSVQKQTPTYYTAWQSGWGSEPENAEDYYYLMWPVSSRISDVTSPYDFTLKDDFSDFGGEVVGYRFSGTSAFVSPDEDGSATIKNVTGPENRTDYVLVRYRKDTAEAELEENNSYNVINHIEAVVTPVDGKDEPNSKDSTKDWTYKKAQYIPASTNYSAEKWGVDSSGRQIFSSVDISSYQLAEYLSGSEDSIAGLKYYVHMSGYSYAATLADGASGSEQDAIDGKYGQKSVTYTLNDDTFTLKAATYNKNAAGVQISDAQQQMNDEDYDITRVDWSVTMKTATYDAESKKFIESDIQDYTSVSEKGEPEAPFEKNTIYFYVRTEADGWQLAATYNLERYSYTYVNNAYISGTSGKTITFQEGVKGYRITTSNPYYCTYISANPTITLNRTVHVAQILTGNENAVVSDLARLEADAAGNQILTKISVTNEAVCSITQGEETLYENKVTGTDYVAGVVRHGELDKRVVSAKNDKTSREYIVTWQATLGETYEDGDGKHAVRQNSGTFYDLLPVGAVLDMDSIAVTASGETLVAGSFEVTVTENYQGTGRQLMTVRVKEPTDTVYVLTYNTIHSWNAIQDYGKRLRNSIAYETGNADIGDGLPDNGGGITESGLMAGLTEDTADDDDGVKKFLFDDLTYNMNIMVAANTGLMKEVRAEEDVDYSYSTTTHNGGVYSYRVRYANDASTTSSNLIFFDSLEYFYQWDKESLALESDWYGTLTGIDYSQMTEKGIDVVVYVSTIKGLNIKTYYDETACTYDLDAKDENGKPIWTEYNVYLAGGGKLSDVHAIALDARKTLTNKTFTLASGDSLTFTVYMQAPDKVVSTTESEEDVTEDPITYNNIYAYRNVKTVMGEATSLYHQDYTQVHYRVVGNLLLTKVNEEDHTEMVKGAGYTLTGTSDYGTEYDMTITSDSAGLINFTNIEKGTYVLRETICSDDWQMNTETYTVKVDLNGNVTVEGYNAPEPDEETGRFIVTDKPRVHGDLTFEKRDSVSNVLLDGVVFRLSGTSEYGTDVLMYVPSEKGRVTFANVEMGVYELAEAETIDGYIRNTDVWTMVIDANGNAALYETDGNGNITGEVGRSRDYFYQVCNEPLHSFNFVKSSTYGTGIYVGGVEFTLTGISDYGTEVNQTAVSLPADDFGLVTFDGLEPGTYSLQETSVENADDESTRKYQLNPKTYTVVIQADGSFTIDGLSKETIENLGDSELYNFPDTPATGVVTVTKVWEDDKTGDERKVDDIDLTLTTELPSADPRGYTVTFYASGSTFPNGSDINKVIFTSSGIVVDGQYYEQPVARGKFVGWYSDEKYTQKVELNGNGCPVGLSKDTKLYAKWERMAYAVALYGIGVDKDDKGNTMGLTFGPALGKSYVDGFVSHTVDEKGNITGGDAGTTRSGHAYRCIHQDSWETIVYWNNEDPYVYEKCIANGCTHSVELDPSKTTTVLNPAFTASYTGDGPSVLHDELQQENRFWTSSGRNIGGYAASRVRAMLNGADSQTDITSTNVSSDVTHPASIYTEENCLLAAFPQVLQNAIGNRATKYAIKGGKDIAAMTVYDKLWLFSSYELYETYINTQYPCPSEALGVTLDESNASQYGLQAGDTVGYYAKWKGTTSTGSTGNHIGFPADTNSNGTTWWLRSINNGYNNYGVTITSQGGTTNSGYGTSSSGIAPGFSLSRSSGSSTNALKASVMSVADTGDVTYTTKGFTWVQIDDTTYGMDTDSNPDNYEITLTQNGNEWTYSFKVVDDKAEYYVTEVLNNNLDEAYTLLDEEGEEIIYATIEKDAGAVRIINRSANAPGYGSLTLTKLVTDSDGNELTGVDTLFGFTITLSADEETNLGKFLEGSQTFGTVTFTDGVAKVYLKAGQSVTIPNLPARIQYSITETPAEGYTPVWRGESGTITADETAAATCTNQKPAPPPPEEEPKVGDLTVKKTVVNGEKGDSFLFRAVFRGLKANTKYSYTICNSDGSEYKADGVLSADSSGSGDVSFYLTDGQYVIFSELPVGCQYQVMESGTDNAFTAGYEIEGAASVSLQKKENYEANRDLSTALETLDEGEEATVHFTNTKPEPVTDLLKINVTVKKEWGDGNENHTGDTVEVYLLQSGSLDELTEGDVIDSCKLNAANGWMYTFTDLDVYQDPDGEALYYYYVDESKTDGYGVSITEDSDKFNSEEEDAFIKDYSFTVCNYSMPELPMTGGFGNTRLYFFGGTLMIGAAGYGFVLKRRRDKRENGKRIEIHDE